MTKNENRYSRLVSVRIPLELVYAIEDEVEKRQKYRIRKVSFSEVLIDMLDKYFK